MPKTYYPVNVSLDYTAKDSINENLQAIDVAFQKTLSKGEDGVDTLSTDLDMNLFSILNALSLFEGNDIVVEDPGNYFTADTVDGILEEIGTRLTAVLETPVVIPDAPFEMDITDDRYWKTSTNPETERPYYYYSNGNMWTLGTLDIAPGSIGGHQEIMVRKDGPEAGWQEGLRPRYMTCIFGSGPRVAPDARYDPPLTYVIKVYMEYGVFNTETEGVYQSSFFFNYNDYDEVTLDLQQYDQMGDLTKIVIEWPWDNYGAEIRSIIIHDEPRD